MQKTYKKGSTVKGKKTAEEIYEEEQHNSMYNSEYAKGSTIDGGVGRFRKLSSRLGISKNKYEKGEYVDDNLLEKDGYETGYSNGLVTTFVNKENGNRIVVSFLPSYVDWKVGNSLAYLKVLMVSKDKNEIEDYLEGIDYGRKLVRSKEDYENALKSGHSVENKYAKGSTIKGFTKDKVFTKGDIAVQRVGGSDMWEVAIKGKGVGRILGAQTFEYAIKKAEKEFKDKYAKGSTVKGGTISRYRLVPYKERMKGYIESVGEKQMVVESTYEGASEKANELLYSDKDFVTVDIVKLGKSVLSSKKIAKVNSQGIVKYAKGSTVKDNRMNERTRAVILKIQKMRIHPNDVSPNFVSEVADENGINLSSEEVVFISDNYSKKFGNGGGVAVSSESGLAVGTNADLLMNEQYLQYGSGGAIKSANEGTGSSDLRERAQAKIDKGMTVIDFGYTDYGGTFMDKSAIAYFKKHHPKNILVENSGYNGQNAFVFGKPAEQWIEASKDYLLGFEDFEDFYYQMQMRMEEKDFKLFLKDLKSDGYKVSPNAINWLIENKGGYYKVEPNMVDIPYESLTEELIEEGLVSKKFEFGGNMSSGFNYEIGGL